MWKKKREKKGCITCLTGERGSAAILKHTWITSCSWHLLQHSDGAPSSPPMHGSNRSPESTSGSNICCLGVQTCYGNQDPDPCMQLAGALQQATVGLCFNIGLVDPYPSGREKATENTIFNSFFISGMQARLSAFKTWLCNNFFCFFFFSFCFFL